MATPSAPPPEAFSRLAPSAPPFNDDPPPPEAFSRSAPSAPPPEAFSRSAPSAPPPEAFSRSAPSAPPPEAFSRLAPSAPPFNDYDDAPPPEAFSRLAPSAPPPEAFSRLAPSAPPPEAFSRSTSFNLEDFKQNIDSLNSALLKSQFKYILDQQKKIMNAVKTQKCDKECQDANNEIEKNTVNEFISKNTIFK